MKNKILVVAICVALSSITGCKKDDTDSVKVNPVLSVSTAKVSTMQLQRYFSSTGNIVPWQEASVGSELGGFRVQQILADVGTVVKKGEPIAKLNDTQIAVDMLAAKAQIKDAEANAAHAKSVYDRSLSLPEGTISPVELNQYKTAMLSAQAKLDLARAQYGNQLIRMQNTFIVAPDDGVISYRNASVGNVVGAGTEMFRLIRQSKLEWRSDVSVDHIAGLEVGQSVKLDGYGQKGEGQITKISPVVDPALRTGSVFVSVDPKQFKSGMFIKGTFMLNQDNVLSVPVSSVIVRDGINFVPVVKSDKAIELRKVTLGLQQNNQVEIINGLKQAEQVVVRGGSFLNSGDLVKVVEELK